MSSSDQSSDYGDDKDRPESTATVVRADDGTLYVLRKEVLEACRVKEPEAVELCNQLLDSNTGVTGFQIGTGATAKSVTFTGPFNEFDPGFNPDWQVSSTVMCPGNMRWFDFAAGARGDGY
jgi:hypothetical protein